MEAVYSQLLSMLSAFWWPFCRVMAMLVAAPVLGENMVPMTLRVMLAMVLAVILMPGAPASVVIDPLSLHGVVATLEQGLIGFALGLAFHLTMAAILMLGFLVSSQMGLSMAVMNDPMNGASSDVVSSLLYMMCVMVFFSVDGHLVLTGVLGASFQVWPVGQGLAGLSLQTLALNVSWAFAAALLLALPVIFSTLVVQVGFGLLNRVAPTLNLYALGFSVVTVFGLFMLVQVVRFVPDHYLRMSAKVLQMINDQLRT